MNRTPFLAALAVMLAFGPTLVSAAPAAVTVKIDNFAFDAQTITVPRARP